MKTRRTLKKKITSKKYKKTRYRRYNMRINLTSKMKGGASSTILKSAYINYRQEQKNDASKLLEEIKYTAPQALRSKIEKLNNLLPIHIVETQHAPNTERWRTQEHKLYILISTINLLLVANSYEKDGRKLHIFQPFLESTSVTNDIEPSQQSRSRSRSRGRSRSRSRGRSSPTSLS